ncbi:MAG: hypothetical protein V4673_15445 [Pseudomonadota bacterium]
MLTDTGHMSLILGLALIASCLLGMFAAYRLSKNPNINPEKFEKLVELGKWSITAVGVVVITSIVSDGFKERDQDIKEVGIFEKHTETILKADGPDQRMLLAEYFAAVSPKGSLKDSWEAYRDRLEDQAKKRSTDTVRLDQLSQIKNLTEAQKREEISLASNLAAVNQPLAPSAEVYSGPSPRVYFHIDSEPQRCAAGKLRDALAGFEKASVPGIQLVETNLGNNELRYFKISEKAQAEKIAEKITALGLAVDAKYIRGHETSTKIRPRHYELWIGGNASFVLDLECRSE